MGRIGKTWHLERKFSVWKLNSKCLSIRQTRRKRVSISYSKKITCKMEGKSFGVGALWDNTWRAQGTYYFHSH